MNPVDTEGISADDPEDQISEQGLEATPVQVCWPTVQDEWVRTGALRRLCARGRGLRSHHEIDELYAEVNWRVWVTWARRPGQTVDIHTSLEAYLARIVDNTWRHLARKEIRERDLRLRINQPLRPRGLPAPAGDEPGGPRLRRLQGLIISLDDPRWPEDPVSQDRFAEPESVLDVILSAQLRRALRVQLTRRLATGDYVCPHHLATRSGQGCARQPGMLVGAALGLVNRVPELGSWHAVFAQVCQDADPARFGTAPAGMTDRDRRAHDHKRAKARDRLEACVLHLVDSALQDTGCAQLALVAAVRVPMTWAVLQRLTQHAKPEEKASHKVVAALSGWLDQLLRWWRGIRQVGSFARKNWIEAGEDLCQRLASSAGVIARAAAAVRLAQPATGSVEASRLVRAESVVENLMRWHAKLEASTP